MTPPIPPESSAGPEPAVTPDAMAGPEPEPATTPDAMAAAASDLERLQEVLRLAGQGQADLGQVTESFSDYWRDHNQALAAAATALGEPVRRQMLTQLHTWRSQLGPQLQNPDVSNPPSNPQSSDREGSDRGPHQNGRDTA